MRQSSHQASRSEIIRVKTPRKITVAIAIESGERLLGYSDSDETHKSRRNRVFLFRRVCQQTINNLNRPVSNTLQPPFNSLGFQKSSATGRRMAHRTSGPSKLPKAAKNPINRLSSASSSPLIGNSSKLSSSEKPMHTPRSSLTASKLPIRASRTPMSRSHIFGCESAHVDLSTPASRSPLLLPTPVSSTSRSSIISSKVCYMVFYNSFGFIG